MVELIKQAIAERRLLALWYFPGERIVEPHLLGYKTGTGNLALSAYQEVGATRSGEPYGWKNFLLSELRDVRLLEGHFAGPRPGYNPNDRTMQTILYRL